MNDIHETLGILFFLLGSLIALRYLGSVKTTTSNNDKEIFLIIKNMICNIILINK